jgi:2-oxoglutarate dehydrogenase E1 component
VDEFISSGEQKWGQRSGVVLLLPHGYEGQGPDHSSARIERFLSLCAQDNMTVARPSTPASYFHLLRWQALSGRIKPLIVFTPKSMLRLKTATSAAAEFTSGSFRPVLGDPALGTTAFDGQAAGTGPATGPLDPAGVRRVLLCSGKFYYDLADRRQAAGLSNIAIVRLERLYPLPAAEIAAELSRYPADAEVVWAQEEPANMGSWPYMGLQLPSVLGRPIVLVSLPPSSAPAAGSAKAHAAEHAQLVDAALGLAG